jgi:hypothetical protein
MKKGCIRKWVAFALMLGLSVPVMAGQGVGAVKLDGAWVAKVVDAPGGQWSYVISADPSGRRAAGHGSIDVGFRFEAILGAQYFEPTDSNSPILIDIVMTGPDTASYHAVWYGLKDLDPPNVSKSEIVVIGVVTGDLQFVEPGKAFGTHNFELYYPWQDGDGDGFPDEGETTPFVFQLTTVDTRVPSPW